MLTFLLVLVAVFIGVDLLVRFVIDPLASGSYKKNKVSKPFASKFDPTLKLASETMYDGGQPHEDENSKETDKSENITEDDSSTKNQ
ncbi:MAG: hypothetical protein H3C40_03335 [Ignavibacterium sp.]|nr:hypothetical protein [Ignavibacterium sp.]